MLIAIPYCKLLYKVLRWRLCFCFSSLPSSYLSTGLYLDDRQLGLLVQSEAYVLLFSSNGSRNCELNLPQSLTFSCLPWNLKPTRQNFLKDPNSLWLSLCNVRTLLSVQCAHLLGVQCWNALPGGYSFPALRRTLLTPSHSALTYFSSMHSWRR